ncbi:hypothetical protein QYZ88_017270 [Lachnospiraceae bacterium C1.1]|nr:hypothetical protein [Lachnospiraceae bacterium C1.1]
MNKEKENPLYSDSAYDDAFRTMETKCDDLVIPFVNHMFGENYDKTAKIKRLRNERFIVHENKSEERRITDSSFEIEFEKVVKRYHLECESKKYDGSILIRIFEYDSQIALENSVRDLFTMRFKFPNSGLLLLRQTDKTPEKGIIELEMPDGNIASYNVSIVKMSDYDIDSIFEKKLYMLIPFYIFNFESEFDEIDRDEKRLEKLFDDYQIIYERLKKEVETGNLSLLSFSAIIRLINSVAYKLTLKREKIREKVVDVMGGQVLDLPEFKLYDQGKADGRAEGLRDGRAEGLRDGRAEGIREGAREGRAEGVRAGIRIFIEDKIEDGVPKNIIIEKVQKRFGLSEKEARDFFSDNE